MSVLPTGIHDITFYYLLTFSVMNIYIGNLNYRVKESDLQRVMEEYAPVTSIKLIKDRETGKSKGFGFVEIENEAAARQAISELNGSQYEGRTMVVKEALPR
jgi:RNA recognition motif-containing protein